MSGPWGGGRGVPDFIYDIPTETLAVWLSLAAVAIMFAGLLVLKPILRLLLGSGPDFNQTVNFATSGFNLFYGLLLGLLTVAAYQNNERVKLSILTEATTLGGLYADLNSYPEPTRSDMKEILRDYVLFTIYKDWPAHRRGEFLNGGFNRANAMRQLLARFEPETKGQEILHAEVIASFQAFAQARQQRLLGVITEIPAVLWYAVLVGAAISILLVIVLRMRPVQQFALGSVTAFFLGVILFVIVTLDRPLRGESGLDPAPFRLLWERSMIWDEPLG
jgi:hypothetical protein